MFASPNFGIAHSLCNGLQYSTLFGRVGWQLCNVPLRNKIISLQHGCSMTHTMKCRTQCFLYALTSFSGIGRGIE